MQEGLIPVWQRNPYVAQPPVPRQIALPVSQIIYDPSSQDVLDQLKQIARKAILPDTSSSNGTFYQSVAFPTNGDFIEEEVRELSRLKALESPDQFEMFVRKPSVYSDYVNAIATKSAMWGWEIENMVLYLVRQSTGLKVVLLRDREPPLRLDAETLITDEHIVVVRRKKSGTCYYYPCLKQDPTDPTGRRIVRIRPTHLLSVPSPVPMLPNGAQPRLAHPEHLPPVPPPVPMPVSWAQLSSTDLSHLRAALDAPPSAPLNAPLSAPPNAPLSAPPEPLEPEPPHSPVIDVVGEVDQVYGTILQQLVERGLCLDPTPVDKNSFFESVWRQVDEGMGFTDAFQLRQNVHSFANIDREIFEHHLPEHLDYVAMLELLSTNKTWKEEWEEWIINVLAEMEIYVTLLRDKMAPLRTDGIEDVPNGGLGYLQERDIVVIKNGKNYICTVPLDVD